MDLARRTLWLRNVGSNCGPALSIKVVKLGIPAIIEENLEGTGRCHLDIVVVLQSIDPGEGKRVAKLANELRNVVAILGFRGGAFLQDQGSKLLWTVKAGSLSIMIITITIIDIS